MVDNLRRWSFKLIPVERKVEVIYEGVQREKIQPVTRETGVGVLCIFGKKEPSKVQRNLLSFLREVLRRVQKVRK